MWHFVPVDGGEAHEVKVDFLLVLPSVDLVGGCPPELSPILQIPAVCELAEQSGAAITGEVLGEVS
jgi:hypothetical protein